MHSKKIKHYLVAFLFCIGTLIANAQTKPDSASVVEDFAKSLGLNRQPQKGVQAVKEQEESTGNPVYDSIRFAKEMKEYDFAAAHQHRSFMWQYYSSICIFLMVVTIVGMGLVLSYRQFQLTAEQVRYNLKTTKEERVTVATESATIEASQTGLKINTAVIGLAILFLSLAFFFLYLKYVYVIEVIDTGR